ncbi:MAG: restriction endonuclease subunit S [Gammaproteobacteria bacterium]
MPTIRSITQRTRTWNPSQQARQEIRYVDVSAVSREKLQIGAAEVIHAATAPSRARKLIEADDTIIATIRPGLKRIAKVPPVLHGEVASTAFCVLRPDRTIVDPDYLFYAVASDDFIAALALHETGASYPAIRDQDVLDSEIPLPSLDVQRRITILLNAVRASLLQQFDLITAAERLKAACTEVVFSRGLHGETKEETDIGSVPLSWEVVPLGSLGRVGNGSTPKRTVSAYWDGGHYPWLTSAKVYDRDVIRGDEFVTDTALRECHLPKVQPGALLMAITGQGKTLGHCAVLRTEATVSQHVAYVQTDTTRANPAFLRGYLETQYDYLRQVGAGGGSTKGALTCAFLRSLPVPLPPLAEQNEIAEILDAIDAKIALHQKKRAVLEELFKALLHKLMTGEIDVNDLDLSALQPTA